MGAGDVAAEPAVRPFLATVRLLSTKARRGRRARRRTQDSRGESHAARTGQGAWNPRGPGPFSLESEGALFDALAQFLQPPFNMSGALAAGLVGAPHRVV